MHQTWKGWCSSYAFRLDLNLHHWVDLGSDWAIYDTHGVVLTQRLGGKPKEGNPERKGEMSRASHFSSKAKNSKRNLNITTIPSSRFCHYSDKHVTIWTNNLSGPSDVVSKATTCVKFPVFKCTEDWVGGAVGAVSHFVRSDKIWPCPPHRNCGDHGGRSTLLTHL